MMALAGVELGTLVSETDAALPAKILPLHFLTFFASEIVRDVNLPGKLFVHCS